MTYANLHLHSTYSDASLSPSQLVLIAKSLGYGAIALTDHETDGGNKELMRTAKREGLESVTGVEFYGKVDGINVHLTALDFDPDEAGFRAFLEKRRAIYTEGTRKCVERGIRLGIIQGITWQDVVDLNPDNAWLCIDSVTRTFRLKKIPVPEEFRERVFKGEEPKSFRQGHPSAEEVIRAVRGAGGIIGLAHPNEKTHLVEKLMEFGLNGIEVSHPNITEETVALAEEAAATFRLYRLGGTDHDGALSGCGGKRARPVYSGISEEDFMIMKERRLG